MFTNKLYVMISPTPMAIETATPYSISMSAGFMSINPTLLNEDVLEVQRGFVTR